MAPLVVGLGGATVQPNHDYRSDRALWETTVHHSPGKARPWLNLGHARDLAGDDAGAMAAYRCALAGVRGRARDQAGVNLATLAARRRTNIALLVPGDACAPPCPPPQGI